jgi:hypothetical protein
LIGAVFQDETLGELLGGSRERKDYSASYYYQNPRE